MALSVDAALGIRKIAPSQLGDLPPLLRDAHAYRVETLGALDAELFLVLKRSSSGPERSAIVIVQRRHDGQDSRR